MAGTLPANKDKVADPVLQISGVVEDILAVSVKTVTATDLFTKHPLIVLFDFNVYELDPDVADFI